MSTEPGFTPVFGPNGAVLNAPSMTAEMRGKLRPRTLRDVAAGWRYLMTLVACGAAGALSSSGASGWMRELTSSSPWWAGALSGAFAIACVLLVRQQLRQSLARWEIGAAERRLDLPEWARWSLVIFGSGASAAYAAFMLLYFAEVEQQLWPQRIAAAVVALLSLCLAGVLRWYADRRGWTWRQAD